MFVPSPGIVLSFGQAYAARPICAASNTNTLTALIRLSQTCFIRKGVDMPLVRIPKFDKGLNGQVPMGHLAKCCLSTHKGLRWARDR